MRSREWYNTTEIFSTVGLYAKTLSFASVSPHETLQPIAMRQHRARRRGMTTDKYDAFIQRNAASDLSRDETANLDISLHALAAMSASQC